MVERTVYVGASRQVIVQPADRRGDPGTRSPTPAATRATARERRCACHVPADALRVLASPGGTSRRVSPTDRITRLRWQPARRPRLPCRERRRAAGRQAGCICGGSGRRGQDDDVGGDRAGDGGTAKVAGVTIDPANGWPTRSGWRSSERASAGRGRSAGRAGLEICGELWAMMLDPKRTFDELIERIAPSPAGPRRSRPTASTASCRPRSRAPRSSPPWPSSTTSTETATSTCWCSTRRLAQRARLPRRAGRLTRSWTDGREGVRPADRIGDAGARAAARRRCCRRCGASPESTC